VQPVVVSANSDVIAEGNEQFSLILSNNNVAIAGPSVVPVTILDDDGMFELIELTHAH